jgi:hypothetical protein
MIYKDFYMRNRVPFYRSQFVSLETAYLDCQDIPEPEERSLKITKILTQLEAIDKNSCPENDQALFAFKVEALQLDILYTAFNSKTILEGHEINLAKLTERYQELANSSGYHNLKPWDVKKQKIDSCLLELKRSQGLNLCR